MEEEEKVCDYKENTNEPCKDCPRVMSALYRCGVLQEIQKEASVSTNKQDK